MKKLQPFSLRLNDLQAALLEARAEMLGTTRTQVLRNFIDTLAADDGPAKQKKQSPRPCKKT
jgi:hypothetical protein